MTFTPDSRIASHAVGSGGASAKSIRRWVVVRLILGLLQMSGAAFSLALFIHGGITPLTVAAVIVTGLFTGVSMLLFQVWKRGQR